MTERKWTPGPWMYQYTRLGYTVTQPQHHHAIMVVNYAVEPEADARLIAAAPDLYEALENLSDACDAMAEATNSSICDDRITAARKALAKARGETQ